MAKSTTKKSTLKVTTSTFKDRPVISLPIDEEKSFTFGPAKAKAIIANMGDIILFAQAKPTVKATAKKYKGKPVLNLVKEGRPFGMGEKKAQLIVKHAGDIAQFVAKNS
jgi:hypothetical protein